MLTSVVRRLEVGVSAASEVVVQVVVLRHDDKRRVQLANHLAELRWEPLRADAVADALRYIVATFVEVVHFKCKLLRKLAVGLELFEVLVAHHFIPLS